MEPPVVYRDLTSVQLIQEVSEWASANFTTRYPFTALLGMLEEVGETAHCVLKNLQGIRGFSEPSFFRTHLTDALSDTVIYLADYCAMKGCFFTFHHNDISMEVQRKDEQIVVTHVIIGLTSMFNMENSNPDVTPASIAYFNVIAQKFLTALELWGNIHSIDLQKVTNETWCREVSKRDWKKHLLSGAETKHEPAVD